MSAGGRALRQSAGEGPTDADLVRDSLAGDAAAWRTLYERHRPLVLRLCLDSVPAEAEDLCQEVFLRVCKGLSGLREPQALAAWLIRVSRRVVADRLRGRRRAFVAFEAAPEPVVGPPPEDRFEDAELEAALRGLPDRERLALHLHYLNDTPAETARASLRLSESGYYKLLDRARGSLRRRLREIEAATPREGDRCGK